MKSWTLTIPAVPPSANVFMRWHWSRRHRLKSQWPVLVSYALARVAIPKARGKRRVRIVITRRRLIDPANLHLAVDKLLFDDLVSRGILLDDSARWLDYDVEQRVGGEECTTVEISNAITARRRL